MPQRERLSLGVPLPTPVQRMDRLGAELGLAPGRLWVKRDDLTGLAGGGNKARKLEHLCAEAVADGCDVLVTGGGPQSNHVRMTAGAANLLGLDCSIVLAGDERPTATGNIVLDRLLDPTIVWAGPIEYYALEDAISAETERLRGEGRRPYLVPVGGASPTGALGYVDCARELRDQIPHLALVVVGDGSGGSHAGLAAGLGSLDLVLGVDSGTRPDLDEMVPVMARDTAAAAGLDPPGGTVQVDHDRIGGGYGAPTDGCLEALRLTARAEGLFLDPVYSGKAMAGLVAAARDGRLPASGAICFVATGGLPAIFEPKYADWV